MSWLSKLFSSNSKVSSPLTTQQLDYIPPVGQTPETIQTYWQHRWHEIMDRTNPEPEEEAMPMPDDVGSDNRLNFFSNFAFTEKLPTESIEEMMLLLPYGSMIFQRLLSFCDPQEHEIDEQEALSLLREQLTLCQKLGYTVSSPDQPIRIIKSTDTEGDNILSTATNPFDEVNVETKTRVHNFSGEFGKCAFYFLSLPLFVAAGCRPEISLWICQPLQAHKNDIDITDNLYRLRLGGWLYGQNDHGVFLYDMRSSQTDNED